jgi:GDP-mannose 6-dehydrogenase
MRVSVFGLGYVGCVTAVCLAQRGHRVVGVDVNPTKVDALNAGSSPIVEPGLPGLTAIVVEKGCLRATTDASVAVQQSELSLICVGTPSQENGGLDLSYVKRAAE